MATTSVVRIGPTEGNLSAKVLRNAIASYFQEGKDDDDSGGGDGGRRSSSSADVVIGAATGAGDSDEAARTIVVRNKYFSAQVALEATETGGATTPATATGGREDGVILVFDAVRSNPDRPVRVGGGSNEAGATCITFDALRAVHERAETDGACGDLLRLCVGVSVGGDLTPEELRGTNHEQEYSRRILWCLDHGYEYVEADLSHEGQLRGHGVRDKDGFARIVEAVEGTMWSSAVMCRAKTTELKASYATDRSAVHSAASDKQSGGGTEISTTVVEDPEEGEENLYQPPDPSMLVDKMVEDDGTNDAAVDPTGAGLHVNGGGIGAEDIAQLRQDLEAEKLFDEMERTLREASRIREASKNGTLTDEERRDRAGEAALRLVNLMTNIGLDEGDDSDGYDSDGSGVLDTVEDSGR